MIAGAKKEMAANPQEIIKAELSRKMGDVQILERQRVGKPAPLKVSTPTTCRTSRSNPISSGR